MTPSPDARVARLAARQHSVFTRGQALACGFTSKMIRGRVELGLWLPVHRGVYRLAGASATPESNALAACLATGGAAAARTAALLWAMPVPRPSEVEVVVPHGVRRRHERIRTRQSSTLVPGDIVKIGVVPVTSPARTLLDLAGTLTPRQLEVAFDDALARRLVSLDRLAQRLDRLPPSGSEGVGVLRGLIQGCEPLAAKSKSHLSQSFVRLFQRLGLPEPVVEMPIRLADGRLIHADLGYPDQRVAIEIQSQRWHTGRRKTEADLARENELELAAYRLLHLTDSDRRRPAYVRRVVRAVLESI